MMTLEIFKKRMGILEKYCDYENELDKLGISLWERKEISNLITEYTNLIAEAFNLPHNDIYGTELDYYIYELHWGTEENEHKEFQSLENLYNYFCQIAKGEIDFK